METESIDKAIDIITKSITESDINEIDKLELLLNLYHFLNDYENNIETLRKVKK